MGTTAVAALTDKIGMISNYASMIGVAVIAFILCMIIIALAYAASCLITCGIVYLIAWCFGWEFSWPIGIGVWLVIMLLKKIFTVNVSSSK